MKREDLTLINKIDAYYEKNGSDAEVLNIYLTPRQIWEVMAWLDITNSNYCDFKALMEDTIECVWFRGAKILRS